MHGRPSWELLSEDDLRQDRAFETVDCLEEPVYRTIREVFARFGPDVDAAELYAKLEHRGAHGQLLHDAIELLLQTGRLTGYKSYDGHWYSETDTLWKTLDQLKSEYQQSQLLQAMGGHPPAQKKPPRRARKLQQGDVTVTQDQAELAKHIVRTWRTHPKMTLAERLDDAAEENRSVRIGKTKLYELKAIGERLLGGH